MSLFIDVKYLNQISNKLSLFKKKDQYIWNCRCPICGDSQAKKNKARGYFYRQKNDLYYKCHNCDASQHFGTFLRDFDGTLYREYRLERYGNGENRRAHANPEDELKKMFTEPVFSYDDAELTGPCLLDQLMPRISTLSADHEARIFCTNRRIPDHQLSRLYFIDDMRNIVQLSDKMKGKIKTAEPRLVIPYRDRAGKLVGVSCRGMRNEALRYIMVRIDEAAPMIFGLENMNPLTTVYAVEGPIDSLFLPNAVAVGGTGFGKLQQLNVEHRRLTVVIDNQPRNREVVAVYKKAIDAGHKVFIWPDLVHIKDLNDLANLGYTQTQIQDMIDNHTHEGLQAMIKFNNWKRV
jgi:hypothetical protein